MKILWFTNIPMPDVNSHFGRDAKGTGGWMGALLELLKKQPGLSLGVATACSHYPTTQIQIDGVDYFVVRQPSPLFRRALFPVDNDPATLKCCVDIVKTFKPDIVHIHGTERFYGKMMSKGLVNCPVVFSIQGIMDAYHEWYRWFGKLSIKEIISANLLTSLKFSGLLWDLRMAKQQARREQEYFRKGHYFLGRTDWDKAYISYFNNQAQYFKIFRVLRPPFWRRHWQLEKCKRHRIIFTNTRHPRKGTELLLQAFAVLQPLYPDMELVLVGSLGLSGYAKKTRQMIDGFGGKVKSLGQLNAEEISRKLCRAHLFVSASYIENSPNSVAEAQLVGMPVISSYTGGTPSMIEEGRTGLFFPTGDVPLLVSRIRAVFDNDTMAIKLGKNAKEAASKRHDPEQIVKDQLAAYATIFRQSQKASTP